MKLEQVLLGMAIILSISAISSCKKENSTRQVIHENLKNIQGKINTWLETQKSVMLPTKAENIELLKSSLDFSETEPGVLGLNETFLIVAVREAYNVKRKVAKESMFKFFVVFDKVGNIVRANLVQYTAASNAGSSKIPAGTFQNLFHSKKIGVDGEFKFMSMTGRYLYELSYAGGRPKSFKILKQKQGANASRLTQISSSGGCTDWYLVTSLYENGVLVNQFETYLGTTCPASTGCNDLNPNMASICPDDPGGSGGGGAIDCCVAPDDNFQLNSETISGPVRRSCGAEGINPETGQPKRNCVYSWDFNRSSFMGWSWTYYSEEAGEFEKQNGVWKFKSVTHSGQGWTGSQPACLDFPATINSPIATIRQDRRQARMRINFTINARWDCGFISNIDPVIGSNFADLDAP